MLAGLAAGRGGFSLKPGVPGSLVGACSAELRTSRGADCERRHLIDLTDVTVPPVRMLAGGRQLAGWVPAMRWHIAGWRAQIRRLLRWAGVDRNPLCRGVDRAQAAVRAGLLVVFLAGAPVVTVQVSHAMYGAGLREAQAQAAAWHQVPALVVRVTSGAAAWRSARPPARLDVRWMTPAGSARTAEIPGARDVVAGSSIAVWVDERGGLVHRPVSRADVAARVMHAAVAVVAGFALGVAAVSGLLSLILDRVRLAAWEAEWSAVEPRWSHRR